jgi:multidrug efflux pump subunit AcrB
MIGPNLSAWGIRQQAITLFLIIAIAVAGLYAFFKLGRGEDPTFTVKVLTVTAIWPGASAQDMRDQVADRLEKRMQELRYYDRVETVARAGFVTMKLTLNDATPAGAVADQFYQLRKKLSDERLNLPQGVVGPIINDEYADVYFSLFALQAKGLPQRGLIDTAESLRQRLLRLPGVEKVNILGEQARRIYVDISHERLASLDIDAQAVVTALQSHNEVTPAGFADTAGPRIYLRTHAGLESVAAVQAVPLLINQRIVRLGDIADVSRGYEDPPQSLIRHQGEPTVLLGVVMTPHYNGLTLGRTLAQAQKDLRAELPLGLVLTEVADQARVIDAAINEFMLKFLAALAVVLAVSLVSLGLRVGIVVALAVPLTLAAVFVVMFITGRDFDRVTLGALILSLGLLVDDAIIAIEMMVVKMEEGMDRVAAATYAWGATAAPMFSGTVVTILGFLPVGFARSSAGEYAGNIFWVVGFALIASWLVAVVFTPYMGVHLLPDIKPVPGGHEAIYATRNYQRLRHVVRTCVNHKWVTAGTTLVLFALSALGMTMVEKQFFPNSDRTELIVEVFKPPGTALAATDAALMDIEHAIGQRAEVVSMTTHVGQGSPRFFLALNPELPNPAYGQIIIQTPAPAARDQLRRALQQHIDNGDFAGARLRVTQLLFGPPVRFPVTFRVVGPDLDQLRPIAQAVRQAMAQNPHVHDAHLDWGERVPTMRLVFDQDRLSALGLSPRQVAQQLHGLLNGVSVTQVREGTRAVDVVLRGGLRERRGLAEVGDLKLRTSVDQSVPLRQVAHLETQMEEPLFKRYNRENYISVQADIHDTAQPPDVTAQILPALMEIKRDLPPGYRIDTGGSVEESSKANSALAAVIPVMIILMLLVIIIQVRSFSTMLMVFATAPLGLVGAVPTLLLFGQAFGFNAILGLIGLAGILMRNTLILVDQIRLDKASGHPDHMAVVESTVRRARPVVLTALAAMLAFIPLTFSTFWGPLAYVLIGGVGVGTVLTLLFLPALYAICFGVKPQPNRG